MLFKYLSTCLVLVKLVLATARLKNVMHSLDIHIGRLKCVIPVLMTLARPSDSHGFISHEGELLSTARICDTVNC